MRQTHSHHCNLLFLTTDIGGNKDHSTCTYTHTHYVHAASAGPSALHHKEVILCTNEELIIYLFAEFLPSITHLLPHSSQDAHTFVPDFDKDTALLAVFDGHGGERGKYINISTYTVTCMYFLISIRHFLQM